MVQTMADRPYHHGNLRAALLGEAERTLREQGIDALSLRDLARQAGVSHAAPRRHFADRQALLDALAASGFVRLGDEVRAAIDAAGEDYQARLRAVATAYVRFATRDAALLELMFAAKNAGPAAKNAGPGAKNAGPGAKNAGPGGKNAGPGAVSGEPPAALREASERLFGTVGELIRQGQRTDELPAGDPERLLLLLVATLQGIAALTTSGRVRADQTDALIADTVALFTRSQR
jgi:AcrR family transcriptional regulator